MTPTPRHPRRRPRWTAVLGATWAAAACGEAPPPVEGDAPHVVATIFPLGDLAGRVGGEDVRIVVLVPPRADPSTFEPSPRQIREVVGARAYLLVGGGMDEWVLDVPGALADIPVVRMNEGVPLRAGGHGEGTGDPHTWLDPVLVREFWLPRIEEALVEAHPAAEGAIRGRAGEVADSLAALDAWLSERLAPVRGRAFVATHAAWGYFAERYGVVEVGAVHESPGREPSARTLAELVDRARATGVRAVFAEPQLGETGARSLAGELGVPVFVVDPLGGPGLEERDGYFDLLRFNGLQMARALGDDP